MSEVLTTIQQQINYQYEQLAYFESLYNQSIVKTNQALALLNSSAVSSSKALPVAP